MLSTRGGKSPVVQGGHSPLPLQAKPAHGTAVIMAVGMFRGRVEPFVFFNLHGVIVPVFLVFDFLARKSHLKIIGQSGSPF